MTIPDDLFTKLAASELAPHKRTAYRPVAENGDPPSRRASKMGGTAWLNPGEAWPACPSCGQPMALVLQLDLATVPEPLRTTFGTGLLQFFFCTNDEPMCEIDTDAYESGAGDRPKSKLVRMIDPQGDGGTAPALAKNPIEPRALVAWQATDDYPISSEAGLDYHQAQAFEAALGIELHQACAVDDKLGGWPHWFQGDAYPSCPECEGPMSRFVYQVYSDNLTNVAFGGDGMAYICQCPDHPHHLDECSQR